jgi:transposase
VATTVVSEIGDMNRFKNPKQLMAYLGLVPSEHSSGNRIRRGSITKTGNSHVRRVLIEAACNSVAGNRVFNRSTTKMSEKATMSFIGCSNLSGQSSITL